MNNKPELLKYSHTINPVQGLSGRLMGLKIGRRNFMRAIITVIGKDMVGILAKVSTICAEYDVNVVEVTQSILQDLFAMIMMVDISKSSIPFSELADRLTAVGQEMGLTIHTMHEDIFNSMHHV